jgi:hypothetical protein
LKIVAKNSIATKRPIEVASSATAIPEATTARVVFLEDAMD